MKEKGNEPVYPSEGYLSQQRENGMTQTGNGDHVQFHGLTKREYFAGLAMIGMTRRFNESLLDDDDVADRIAKRSVLMADALIEQLNKRP